MNNAIFSASNSMMLPSIIGASTRNESASLTNQIGLKNKVLITTKDVVILKTKRDESYDSFTNAQRIVHGPTSSKTKQPFIILFNDENANDLLEIARELIKAYPDEFNKPDDAFVTSIIINGVDADNRIKWLYA